LIICVLEHSEFDISNGSLPILFVWRFKRHDRIFIAATQGRVERTILRLIRWFCFL
jgi:hypothetical protein